MLYPTRQLLPTILVAPDKMRHFRSTPLTEIIFKQDMCSVPTYSPPGVQKSSCFEILVQVLHLFGCFFLQVLMQCTELDVYRVFQKKCHDFNRMPFPQFLPETIVLWTGCS